MKVAILGTSWKCNRYVPEGKDWEHWSCNSLYTDKTISEFRCERWFELHQRSWLRDYFGASPALYHYSSLAALIKKKTKLYLWEEWEELPGALVYPKEEIEALTPRGTYHASSFDWMVAFAIYLNASAISLHGIDFGPTDSGEPLSARPCLEYWLGHAEAKGIEVTVERPSSLFTVIRYTRSERQYGFENLDNIVDEPRIN